MDSAAWQRSKPSLFDIVSCHFPEGGLITPTIKLRPSLVIQVLQDELTESFACKVAFGTKVLKLIHRQNLDLIIQNAMDIRLLGLHRATRFDLDNIAILPWTSEFFGCWSGQTTPVIGSLT